VLKGFAWRVHISCSSSCSANAQNLRFCLPQHRRVVEGLLPDARLLPHLTDLVLKGCMAGPKMPGVVAGLTSLERLSLKSSEFGGGLPPFSSLSRLTFCNLSYCGIDDYRPPLQVCARQNPSNEPPCK